MKKILLALAFVLCAASVSAQDWAIGGRITSGIQVQGEYQFDNGNYLEGRLGLGLINGAGLDFTALHQWNICKMEWTPRVGEWFFDAGAGASIGMASKFLYVGATGCAKLGIEFNTAPVKLAIDYSPTIGPWVGSGKVANGDDGSDTKLYSGIRTAGFLNFGISCVYCF